MQRKTIPTGLFAAGLGLAAWLWGVAPTSAQDAGRPEFGDRVDVREVLLDVLVTDRGGKPVIGLTPDDFVVEENGEPVELTGATFYSSSELLGGAPKLAAEGAAIDTVPRDRYFILLIEDQRKNQGSVNLLRQQIEAGRSAKRWVRESLAPADWVAVLSYDFKLKVHQDFTRDRAALEAAIDSAVTGKEGGNWASRRGEDEGPTLAGHLPSGAELRDRTPRIYDAVELVADAAGHLQGRKNLLFFTIGLGETDRFGIYREEQRYWEPMVEALNDANVAVYTLDLTPADARHSLEGSLSSLASETGGRYYHLASSYDVPLTQIAQENSGYYLLSYSAEHPAGESGFQRVSVELKDPTLKLRTRDGYSF